MASRMKVIIITRNFFHSLQIVRKCNTGELAYFFVRGARVERIRRMRNYLPYRIFRTKTMKFGDVLVRNIFCLSAARIAGKELKRVCVYRMSGLCHCGKPTRTRKMTAYIKIGHIILRLFPLRRGRLFYPRNREDFSSLSLF